MGDDHLTVDVKITSLQGDFPNKKDFMRGRIIGKIEEGRKITDVAREFDIAHSVVPRLWKSFKTTGMCSRQHGGGRVRSTTPAEDRYIVLSAKRNRHATAQQIHRTARLQWCREHHNWTEQDESRFSLSSDCRRLLIWRESGTAYRPENIQEKNQYPTCSIMVWAGIMINGRTRLHVVANGTMTGQRYIDEVLLPHDCLDSEGIQRLVWPARSPDLNPIENVWDALGRQVAGRNYPPTNKNTLIRALTEEWDKLLQQLLDNVVQNVSQLLYFQNNKYSLFHGGHIPPHLMIPFFKIVSIQQLDGWKWDCRRLMFRRLNVSRSVVTNPKILCPEDLFQAEQYKPTVFSSFGTKEKNYYCAAARCRPLSSIRKKNLRYYAGIVATQHVFHGGTVTGLRYRDEILDPYVRPYAAAIGKRWMWSAYLEDHGLERMEWPASPDLNPIEHLWDYLGREVTALKSSSKVVT
ncbi:transposable element Tcb2 transposase [Trichonephila clavipes]|nr:transposable element Tcb2 transposase [Trichonephila clavipes]